MLHDQGLNLESLSEAFLERYNTSGPRYTSYPTAPMWREDFNATAFAEAIRQSNAPDALERRLPLSLYVHLPFCESRCLFCGCNVVITRQREQAEKYLGYLFREIEHGASLIDESGGASRPVHQFHWGGGTPTYLSPEQIQRLFQFQKDHFNLVDEAEIGIEVDPRVTTDEQLVVLRELGFNRISLGVQDFQPQVQEAIHRIQSETLTENMVARCRELGYGGINFDLIYGLPHQSEVSFDRTLDAVIRLDPDRIALYNFAYVPWISPHQKQIRPEALPEGAVKFRIFANAIQRLLAAGYVYIGMDHFAKPTDELYLAQQAGTLHRNFMGYTTQAGCELYGFGVSAISGLHAYYAQNEKKLSRYYEAIDAGRLPTMRGYALTPDDQIRRAAILAILCNGRLDLSQISRGFRIDARRYFAQAFEKLQPMVEDDLLIWGPDGFHLTPLGRIFSRNVAMPFDAYLKDTAEKPLYSKTL